MEWPNIWVISRTSKWRIIVNYMGSNNQTIPLLTFFQTIIHLRPVFPAPTSCFIPSNNLFRIPIRQLSSKSISSSSYINDCWCSKWATSRSSNLRLSHLFSHLQLTTFLLKITILGSRQKMILRVLMVCQITWPSFCNRTSLWGLHSNSKLRRPMRFLQISAKSWFSWKSNLRSNNKSSSSREDQQPRRRRERRSSKCNWESTSSTNKRRPIRIRHPMGHRARTRQSHLAPSEIANRTKRAWAVTHREKALPAPPRWGIPTLQWTVTRTRGP